MAGEKSGGQRCSVLQVPGTYGPAEMNCDGNVKHRCANCASKAKHSQKATTKKALNEPGSNNSTISVTTGPFWGYRFLRTRSRCCSWTAFILDVNSKAKNCSIRSSINGNNAYISCYTLQENSLSLIISDLSTNCHAYLQRLTDSKVLLFVIL